MRDNSPRNPSPWKEHDVWRLSGRCKPTRSPARLQIVTESWNMAMACPFIVSLPEKNRILMLLSRGYPYRPMLTESDDGGSTWTAPRYFRKGDPAAGPHHALAVALTSLGNGRLMLSVGDCERWASADSGRTWDGPFALEEAPGGTPWYQWDPYLVDRDPTTGLVTRVVETGYTATRDTPSGGRCQACIRFSDDGGRAWSEAIVVPEWKGFNEVALLRAANGDIVAACRSANPERFGMEIDHYEGLGVSISRDQGRTWSPPDMLYEWGRHHPSMVVMTGGDIVMTYVVRKGYTDSKDGCLRFGVEAVVSRDNGRSWDLDHRFILAAWEGNLISPDGWGACSQGTSTLLLPDGSLLTAFGTGYRGRVDANGMLTPRDVGLVHWNLDRGPVDDDRTVRDAPYDSDARNVFELPPDIPSATPTTAKQQRYAPNQ